MESKITYILMNYIRTNIKNIACSYGYKLVCVYDKFSKLFKSYFGEDAVYDFINSMVEESKYCSEVMKTHFNKEVVITMLLQECLNYEARTTQIHFKINVIPNGLEKYMSFNITNKINFIDSF